MKNFIPIIITFGTFILITLATVSFQSCQDNSTRELTPLSIGDKMPAITATISINGQSNSSLLNNDRTKLTILEFINSHCGTCHKSIAHLQHLQEKFAQEITVILATGQKDSIVRQAATKHHWSLPIITDDTRLGKLFPYLSVPHQVWIKDREVIAITTWQYANEENIRKVLHNLPVKTPLKKEDTFSIFNPFEDHLNFSLYASTISPPLSHGGSFTHFPGTLIMINADIAELYRYAYDRPYKPLDAYTIWEVSDSLKAMLQTPEDTISGNFEKDSAIYAWRKQHTFCYTSQFRSGAKVPKEKMRQFMQSDLNRYFSAQWGIEAALQTRKVPAWVLTFTGDSLDMATSGAPSVKIYRPDHYQLSNQPISTLMNHLTTTHKSIGIPIINATGINYPIDLIIPGGINSRSNINKHLKPIGLQLVERRWPVEMVVIKETKTTQSL